jgi:shikimate kinase
MSVVLIGYRGSGKTSIGRKLADQLWQKFVDVDDLIVAQAGKSIRDIFEQDGEARFREIESEVVRQVVGLNDHVIALGGGSLLREENRVALRAAGHKLIYLRCDPEELARRIHTDPQTAERRPSLTALGGGVEEIRKLLGEREPIYREMMHAELEVTNLSPDEAVVRLVRLM